MDKYTDFEKDVSPFLKKGECSIPMFFAFLGGKTRQHESRCFFLLVEIFSDFPAIAMLVNSGVSPNLFVSKNTQLRNCGVCSEVAMCHSWTEAIWAARLRYGEGCVGVRTVLGGSSQLISG